MKKFILMFAAAVMAVSANAQTVTESKTTDNIYVGVNGGLSTVTRLSSLGAGDHSRFKDITPSIGFRVGRWFTPVVGLALEGNFNFKNLHHSNEAKTFVNSTNVSLLGTLNVLNWIGGYNGEPRCFEVIPVFGLGWGHTFGHPSDAWKANVVTSKFGIDLAYNFGSQKEWQLYVEPSINWNIHEKGRTEVEYSSNYSTLKGTIGLNYKFGNSNGTHNFTIAKLRDQSEIDALNAQINDLRSELAKKPKEVVKGVVKEVVKDNNITREVKVENLVFVTFAQGKTTLTKEAKVALNAIAKGKHVQVVGTASPEGSKEINDKISQSRANSVADYLKSRGIIVDEATGEGVQGTTSNRLAIVYVK